MNTLIDLTLNLSVMSSDRLHGEIEEPLVEERRKEEERKGLGQPAAPNCEACAQDVLTGQNTSTVAKNNHTILC